MGAPLSRGITVSAPISPARRARAEARALAHWTTAAAIATLPHIGTMPRTLRPCASCGEPSRASYCRTCTDPHEQRRSDRRAAYGYSRRHWQQLRTARLELDHYRCTLELPGCTGTATTVHLAPELAGAHDTATLVDCLSCCQSCHGTIDGARAGNGAGATVDNGGDELGLMLA
jgi:hypothetical protein